MFLLCCFLFVSAGFQFSQRLVVLLLKCWHFLIFVSCVSIWLYFHSPPKSPKLADWVKFWWHKFQLNLCYLCFKVSKFVPPPLAVQCVCKFGGPGKCIAPPIGVARSGVVAQILAQFVLLVLLCFKICALSLERIAHVQVGRGRGNVCPPPMGVAGSDSVNKFGGDSVNKFGGATNLLEIWLRAIQNRLLMLPIRRKGQFWRLNVVLGVEPHSASFPTTVPCHQPSPQNGIWIKN